MDKKNNYITIEIYKKVFSGDGILPRSCGLLKIHKLGNSFGIIISSIDSLLSLASYMKLSLTLFQNFSVTSIIFPACEEIEWFNT